MKAFKAKMQELFTMRVDDSEGNKMFCDTKKKIIIPKYQREYSWKDKKVKDLLTDIGEHEKFLGFLILDEKVDHYEIVDGQQRLTTCFLILLALYNAYEQHPLERSDIRGIIMPFEDNFIFENESVGDFAKEKAGLFQIDIATDVDKYYQRDSFLRVFNLAREAIDTNKSNGKLREFKKHFMECEFLVLVNTLMDRSLSIEQLFLDVNEKLQPLEAEDIFKGYCFEKFSENHHDLLKDKWIKLKEISFEFKQKFGYTDTSDYLYMYLLAKDKEISANLTIDGEHYLKQKEMDDVNSLLDEMVAYGNAVIDLSKDVKRTDYYFENMCVDSLNYTNTSDFLVMRDMTSWLIEGSNSTIQKAPFFYFVACQNKYKDLIRHNELRSILTNLYIYAFLFTLEKRKKGKNDLDTTIISELNSENIAVSNLKELAKKLRVDKVLTFELPVSKQFATLSFIYSVIDNYVSSDNFVKKIYKYIDANTGENLEHFVVPEKREGAIKWTWFEKDQEFKIGGVLAKNYKAFTTNYIVLNTHFNGSLQNFDIIRKIELIKVHYGANMPKHIGLYIEHIEGLSKYQSLKTMCTLTATIDDVKDKYLEFLEQFFAQESQYILTRKIVSAFQNAFRNGGE